MKHYMDWWGYILLYVLTYLGSVIVINIGLWLLGALGLDIALGAPTVAKVFGHFIAAFIAGQRYVRIEKNVPSVGGLAIVTCMGAGTVSLLMALNVGMAIGQTQSPQAKQMGLSMESVMAVQVPSLIILVIASILALLFAFAVYPRWQGLDDPTGQPKAA